MWSGSDADDDDNGNRGKLVSLANVRCGTCVVSLPPIWCPCAAAAAAAGGCAHRDDRLSYFPSIAHRMALHMHARTHALFICTHNMHSTCTHWTCIHVFGVPPTPRQQQQQQQPPQPMHAFRGATHRKCVRAWLCQYRVQREPVRQSLSWPPATERWRLRYAPEYPHLYEVFNRTMNQNIKETIICFAFTFVGTNHTQTQLVIHFDKS